MEALQAGWASLEPGCRSQPPPESSASTQRRRAMGAVALLMLGAAAALPASALGAEPPPLGAPTQLLVELMRRPPAPHITVVDTPRPRFSFVPQDTVLRQRNMTHYRVVVTAACEQAPCPMVWDSGRTAAPIAANIPCGVALPAATSFRWTARWWDGSLASAVADGGIFDTALFSADGADWHHAEWLGGGQAQYRLTVPATAAGASAAAAPWRARLHVASPGGATVDVDGVGQGDAVGVSLWADNKNSVPYISLDLTAALRTTAAHVVLVSAGRGFWAPGRLSMYKPYPQGSLPFGPNNASLPTVRFVLLVERAGSAPLIIRSGAAAGVHGRAGSILEDNPWTGCTIDTRLSDADNWTAPLLAAPGAFPAGVLFPLPGYAETGAPQAAERVLELSPLHDGTRRYVYHFPKNIVGHAALRPGAVTGAGNVTVEHCELWNTTAGGCVAFARAPPQTTTCALNGCDTYLIDVGHDSSAAASPRLHPRFTWHGFQTAMVLAGPGVTFAGELGHLSAHWTTAALTETAHIEFEGEGAELLSQIRDMVKATQRSNLAAFMPTDCPTREKKGWLGDSSVSAVEAMLNSWTAGVHSRYLQQIRDGQVKTGEKEGCIAGMVPAAAAFNSQNEHDPDPGMPIDIGFTAAFPMEAAELYRRFADKDSVERQWLGLTDYIGCQLRFADANGTADLPQFYNYGDWATSVESRSASKAGAGASLSAVNWLLAVDAMATLANDAMGKDAESEHYKQLLGTARRLYDQEFWNETLGTWATQQTEVQTMTAVSLAAGVGSSERRATALASLLKDIEAREDHMAVGYQGARWLLPTLSASGEHDTALRLALQTSEPSFGDWIAKGATTCWENWSGIGDAERECALEIPATASLKMCKPDLQPSERSNAGMSLALNSVDQTYTSLSLRV